MNVWMWAAFALLFGYLPCLLVVSRGNLLNRLIGLELANTLTVLVLIMLAKALDRDFLLDLALTQALLSLGGSLVFIRVLERWI